MVENGHFIVLRRESRKALRETLGVSEAAISDSLNYRRHSLLARRIRVASINHFNGIYF